MKTKIIWFVSGLVAGSLLTLGTLDYIGLHKKASWTQKTLIDAMKPRQNDN